MSIGWIKLHRNLKDWEWYDDINATRLLVHLLLSVNYEDKKWKGAIVKAGSMIYSWETLSNGTGLSIQQLRTSMKKLESSQEVTRYATAKYQAVTLCKWGKMQDGNSEVTANLTAQQQHSNSTATTTKEVKKLKKEKKEEDIPPTAFSFYDSLINLGATKQLSNEWLAIRKNKKATNSETAFNAFKSQLNKTNANVNEVLELCVVNSWKGYNSSWYKEPNKEPRTKQEIYEEELAKVFKDKQR